MKKMMKRLTALMLALALIAGQVVIPTGAAEEPTTPDSSQQSPPGPENAPEPAPQPDYDTGPVTTTDSSGKETTTQESQKTSSDGTVTTEKSVSTEQHTSNNENTYSKDTYTWESEKTEDPKDTTVTNADGSVTVTTGEKVTKEEGNHTEETTRDWRPNNEEQVTEVSHGSSTKTEVNTVVETTTEKNVALTPNPELDPDALGEDPDFTELNFGDQDGDKIDNVGDENLKPDTENGNEANAFSEEGGVYGDTEFSQKDNPTNNYTTTSDKIAVTVDPLTGNKSVSITMRPNGQSVTASESFDPTADLTAYIEKEEVLADYTKSEDGKTYTKTVNGVTTTITLTYDKDNPAKLIGYDKKTVTPQAAEGAHTAENITNVTTTIEYDEDDNGNIKNYTEKRKPDLSEAGIDLTQWTEVTDESGNKSYQQDILDKDNKKIGTKTMTLEEIDDNEHLGYKITTTEETDATPATLADVPTVKEEDVKLPTRPAEQSPTLNADGRLEEVKVTNILKKDKDGNVVKDKDGNDVVEGYKVETIVTLADGTPYSSKTETIMGTITTTTNVTETPESAKTTKVTETIIYGTTVTQMATVTATGTTEMTEKQHVEDASYQLVQVGDGYYVWYKGTMTPVTAITTGDGKIQGKVSMTSLKVDNSLSPSSGYNTTTGMRAPDSVSYTESSLPGYEFQYVDSGLESLYWVATQDDYYEDWLRNHQFILEGPNDELFYVYCADFEISPEDGAHYNMVNVSEGEYFTDDEALKVEAIAKNGYWGTKSGVGSLEAVKTWLKDQVQADIDAKNAAEAAGKSYTRKYNISVNDVDSLNHGMALTATQAAIWLYGNSGSDSLDFSSGGNVSEEAKYGDTTTNDQNLINALCKALSTIDVTGNTSSATELLNEKNFATEAKLTVQGKLDEVDDDNNQLYGTTLEVKMAVKYSDLTGNLVVTAMDKEGNILGVQQLTTSNSNFVGKLLADGSYDDESTVTFPNLKIADGVAITVNITGDQILKQGAYLFSAPTYQTSQTFVGVASGTQEVNLSVQVTLEVDPEMALGGTSSDHNEEKTTFQNWSKSNRYKRSTNQAETYQAEAEKTVTFGTRITEKETVEEIVTQAEWDSYETYTESSGGGTPRMGFRRFRGDTTDLKEFEAGLTILDEPVPLAAAPITGDVSAIWGVVSAASMAAYFMMSKKRKDD